MKYTQQELRLKSDNELDEMVAIAQGWATKGELADHWHYRENGFNHVDCYYHPTTNKEQAWDLMIKYDLTPMKDDESYDVLVVFPDSSVYVSNHDPLVAVTIAAILAAQEGN